MNKYFGFKSVIFIFTTIVISGYVFLCSSNRELISLQGLMLAWVGMGATIVGVREYTKNTFLKKLNTKKE